MAMGKRRRHATQMSMWVATGDLLRSAAHPFYARLNQIFDKHDFDGFVEGLCRRFYADDGRPGLPPGRYFRLLLIGYFEGLDAERAIAWRAADSLALRDFLGLVLPEAPPDHSTVSRTRRLIDLETHEAVFTWVLQHLTDAGLVKGKTIGIDATTLEANAALRSIVRRRHQGELSRLLDKARAGVGHRDADPCGPGTHRSEAEEEGLE
jgi:transposase